jgi:hypothetical protein
VLIKRGKSKIQPVVVNIEEVSKCRPTRQNRVVLGTYVLLPYKIKQIQTDKYLDRITKGKLSYFYYLSKGNIYMDKTGKRRRKAAAL